MTPSTSSQWLIGIDEAGYGPNLGPFVMSAVACQVDSAVPTNSSGIVDLWQLLAPAVRRGVLSSATSATSATSETSETAKISETTPRSSRTRTSEDPRLIVDDSKVVHTMRGVSGLERTLLAVLPPIVDCASSNETPSNETPSNGQPDSVGVVSRLFPPSLQVLLDRFCLQGGQDLLQEIWYKGTTTLPAALTPLQISEIEQGRTCFTEACVKAGVRNWGFGSVILCPRAFNAVLDTHDTKGAVLSSSLACLLQAVPQLAPGDEPVAIFVDKQGGRNTYAAPLQDALPDGFVVVLEESAARSRYRVLGLPRPLMLTFQPRADAEMFGVALASMWSKYLRELLMTEFNTFWTTRVPGLKPTAGYPNDAGRFFQAIQPLLPGLKLTEELVWRRK